MSKLNIMFHKECMELIVFKIKQITADKHLNINSIDLNEFDKKIKKLLELWLTLYANIL